MAPKKKVYNGYSVFMMETRQKLTNQGKKVSMAEMSVYCQKDWDNMSDVMKEEYRTKGKQMKNDEKVGKYTSIGEKVEDVQKQSDDSKSQTITMYVYIDELLNMQPARHFLPKQKFMLIHINPYTCEKEGFYFPAEISLAEFSLEKGLIRRFHQLIGFDQVRTNAPRAPTADINSHAANNHKIDVFSAFPNNYTEILLNIIGFILDKKVDKDIFSNIKLDLPVLYTAHTPIENELMITTSSLYKLFESAVKDPEKNDFNNIIRVFHLDKLFMKLKNACHKFRHPDTVDLALPSVAMATESLSYDVLSTIKSIGCNHHEKLEHVHVCSNYFVCKWINIVSSHCCRYFDIKLVPGSHHSFDLSETESPIEEDLDKINISKFAVNYPNNTEINKPKTLTVNSFPALEGKPSTIIQKPIWNKPEFKANTNSKTITNKEDNFPPLGDSKTIERNVPVTEMNSWSKNASRGRGIISQVQSNKDQLNENSKQAYKGRGLSIDRNK